MRNAAMIQRGGRIIAHPYARAISGVLFGMEPRIALEEGVETERLGEAVRAALDASVSGVPHPEPSGASQRLKPLLKAMKVRSWSALIRGARCVHISDDGHTVVFTPTENKGAAEGFVEHLERELSTAHTTDHELGKVAFQALGLCS